jgi:hypothetical protein
VVGVGKAGGLLAFCFGESGEGVFKALLEGGAGHGVKVSLWLREGGSSFARMTQSCDEAA